MTTVRAFADDPYPVAIRDLADTALALILAAAIEAYRDAEPGPGKVLARERLFEVTREFRCVRAVHRNEGAGT